MVENDQLGFVHGQGLLHFLKLAFSDERTGVGAGPATLDEGRRHGACRTYEFEELTGILAFFFVPEIDMHQDGRFTGFGSFEEQSAPLTSAFCGRHARILGRQAHIARRHHGRDSVLKRVASSPHGMAVCAQVANVTYDTGTYFHIY